ncbi:MAG: YkgJ family cysteine cluster protein [Desulfobulbales bacterium]|nr:YkgJ family cysteine cluster protein [Desulfobulbales bacterium]
MNFPDNVTKLCPRKRFTFNCHPKVECFTECCRDLELALTPYDVLCLCRELSMRSADFIDRYVVVEQDEKRGLPRLYLGMVDDGRASCPFIAAAGCKVYNSRPGACRAYPVGRGVTQDGNGVVREIHVLVREDHCRGFAQSNSYNVAEWFENQGLVEYNMINDEMLGLMQYDQGKNGPGFTKEQQDSFLLALYKLDEFREELASSSFCGKYKLSEQQRQSLLEDDLQLLRFGISWLKEVLYNQKV